jgi:hypothetical protein
MIRDLVFYAQPAEPTIRQVQLHLFTQASFRTDTKTVTDDQHAHHQLRIDRRAAGMAIERCEVVT